MANIQGRSSADGKVSYRVQVRKRGFPPQTATFERKTDAKRWAQDTESAITEGRFFRTTEDRRRTFPEMVEKYIQEELSHKKAKSQQGQKNPDYPGDRSPVSYPSRCLRRCSRLSRRRWNRWAG